MSRTQKYRFNNRRHGLQIRASRENIYLIILSTLLFSNSIIAQTDTSFDSQFWSWINSDAKKQIVTVFEIDSNGKNIRIDTIKYFHSYGKYNKIYEIYFNSEIYKKMVYYKNRLSFEQFYTRGKESKRMTYSDKRPYFLQRISYYTMGGDRYKIEYYNKNGELCKEINGEEAHNFPLKKHPCKK